ncbi:hypothetical protein D3C71_1800810 [compost metagenome]
MLDVEGAVLKTAEGRYLGDIGKFAQVGAVGIRVGLDQVLAPADDAFNGVLRIQRGDQVQLATLAEDDPPDRQMNLDLAAQQVGDCAEGGVRIGGVGIARRQRQ